MSSAVPSAANVYLARQARSTGHDDGNGNITRCPCGHNTDSDGFMIACETCTVWQHGSCVGVDDKTVPDQYYCELCMPEHPIHIENAPRRKVLAEMNKNGNANQNNQIKRPGKPPMTDKDKDKTGAKRKRTKKEEEEDAANGGSGANQETEREKEREINNAMPDNKKMRVGVAPVPGASAVAGDDDGEDDKNVSREERKLKKLLESIKKMEDRMTKKSGKPAGGANPGGASPSYTGRSGDFADAALGSELGGSEDDGGRPASQATDYQSADNEQFQVKISSLDPSAPTPLPLQGLFPVSEDGDHSPPPSSALSSPTVPVSSLQAQSAAAAPSNSNPAPSPGPGRPPKIKKVVNNQPAASIEQDSSNHSSSADPESRPFPGSSFHQRRQLWRSNRLLEPLGPMYFGLKQYILDQWQDFQHEKNHFGWTKRAQTVDLTFAKRILVNQEEKKKIEEKAPWNSLALNQPVAPEDEGKLVRYVEKEKPKPEPTQGQTTKEPEAESAASMTDVVTEESKSAPMEINASEEKSSSSQPSASTDSAMEVSAPAESSPPPADDSKEPQQPAASEAGLDKVKDVAMDSMLESSAVTIAKESESSPPLDSSLAPAAAS